MIIALASPRVATSLDHALDRIDWGVSTAASQGARIVCFPEAYLPGLRGMDFAVPPFSADDEARALQAASAIARRHRIAAILGMEHVDDGRRYVAAVVLDSGGGLVGRQTKNQLDPTEDAWYMPGADRRMFEVDGLRFGIAICHEGFRYPETVRWAAARGAKVVFHPHCTGSDRSGPTLVRWGAPDAPYYEKAMMCRGLENTVYFASVNYAFRYQESATSIITPAGALAASLPYGEEGVLVHEIDLHAATGELAARYAPERYRERRDS